MYVRAANTCISFKLRLYLNCICFVMLPCSNQQRSSIFMQIKHPQLTILFIRYSRTASFRNCLPWSIHLKHLQKLTPFQQPLQSVWRSVIYHVRPFILQKYSGITIGDIGAKFSMMYNGSDNGYLMFDHVRIPLDQMLMGLSKVV